MLLSVVSVLVVAQSSSEVPEGLMNNPVQLFQMLILSILSSKFFPLQLQSFALVSSSSSFLSWRNGS